MQARVKWVENSLMVGESGSGHAIVLDGPPEQGGRNLGVRPMELLLIGMGACSELDVLHILKRARQKVTACSVEVTAERATTEPKVFTHIHAHFQVSGEHLDAHKVERAVNLSAEKYCSASIMLGAMATITHDFEIV